MYIDFSYKEPNASQLILLTLNRKKEKKIAICFIARGKAGSVRLRDKTVHTHKTIRTVLYRRLKGFFKSNFDYM